MSARRVAFISDLHANLVALDAVFADIDGLGIDEIVCLGDIVDLGPEPRAMLERLREREVRCIRGNHDTLDEGPAHPGLAAVEAWTREQLGEAELRHLAELPEELHLDLDGLRVLCVHGSPHDVNDQVLDSTPAETLREWTASHDFDVMVGGHTHVQLLRRLDRSLIVNVGSVGMPFMRAFDGGRPQILPWSEYAIVSRTEAGASVELRRVDYDFQRFAATIRACGFPEGESWLDSWID